MKTGGYVLHHPVPEKSRPCVEPSITVRGQRRNYCCGRVHLSTLLQNATINDEINVRIARASAIFDKPHANVSKRRGISLETKLKVYKAVVGYSLAELLYTRET